MPQFRVVAGSFRTPDGERAEAGDIVEVDEDVAQDFPNTFERVESDEVGDEAGSEESSGETTEETEATPEGASDKDIGDTSPDAEIPEDYSALSSMAAEFDGDEIHGAMSGDEIIGFLETLSLEEVEALKTEALGDGEGGDE